MGQRGIVESIGAGARHGAGHIGHGIMHDAIDGVGRRGMGGGMAGFKAAALIDSDIDQHRARLHGGQHRLGHQLGRGGTGDQHRADHQIGLRHGGGQIGAAGKQRLGTCLLYTSWTRCW